MRRADHLFQIVQLLRARRLPAARLRAAQDEGGRASERTVRPLCLAFWGWSWTAGAWCELRRDFRNFRPDRRRQVTLLDERFSDEQGKDLGACLRAVEAELACERGAGSGPRV